jgi:hypothetical protein
MTLRPSHLVLVDASIATNAEARRACTVAAMAAELIRYQAFADPRDARLTLSVAGYPSFEIELLIDDARQVAAQHVVAMEMTRS